MIVAKCPLRVSLVGGSTDLEEFIDTYGMGSVISFPSNLYVYVSIHKNHREKIIVNYSSKEEVEDIDSIKNDVARVVMQHFRNRHYFTGSSKWITITFNSDVISHGSGLATSTAYTIALIKAMAMYNGKEMSEFEICKLAIELERQFNPLTGYQDSYGCGISGFKRIVFEKNKRPKFRYFETKFLQDNFDMCLIYTGIKRSSTDVLKSIDVSKSYSLLELVNDMDEALDANDVDRFLKGFNKAWIAKRQSSPKIFDEIDGFDKFETLLNQPSVLGYKLLGAGAGGYFLLLLKPGTLFKLIEDLNVIGMEYEPIAISVSDHGVKGYTI